MIVQPFFFSHFLLHSSHFSVPSCLKNPPSTKKSSSHRIDSLSFWISCRWIEAFASPDLGEGEH